MGYAQKAKSQSLTVEKLNPLILRNLRVGVQVAHSPARNHFNGFKTFGLMPMENNHYF
jgi:hypothetical protein